MPTHENIIIESNCRNVDGDRANSLDPLFETRDSLIKVPHKRRSCRNFKNKIVRFKFCDYRLCIGIIVSALLALMKCRS